MKSEQFFQIDRQINQIRRDLEQRHEKVMEWNVPLVRILKSKPNKDFYLSKKYSESNLQHYLEEQNEHEEAKELLKLHSQKSREKVQYFKNDLRELQELIKKRNIFRLTKANNFFTKTNKRDEDGGKCTKKDFSKTNYEPSHQQMHRKNDREHSVFAAMKGQKLLEIYQEGKTRSGGNEQALSHLKRCLGVGLENTPFYGWAQRKKVDQIARSKPKLMVAEKRPCFRFQQHLKQEIEGKKSIYLSTGNQKKQQFEQRLKRIIRFNQESVNKISSWAGIRI